ncbi:MAG: prolyl oligopeptidase family serine peptidase, partial [Candidatus Aminicenantes bacterium]|nr:prolyl oligopeptidase family serine peptidase [Candidatus Aminicenantes bacterium]
MKRKEFRIWIMALVLTLLMLTFSSADQDSEPIASKEISLSSWLKLGPFSTPLPAFYDSKNNEFDLEDFLKFNEVDVQQMKPEVEGTYTWHDGSKAVWQTIQAKDQDIKMEYDSEGPASAYLAAYIDTEKFIKGQIRIASSQPFRIYLDGRRIHTKTEDNTSPAQKISIDVDLETGAHLLFIKSVYIKSENSSWGLRASLNYTDRIEDPRPKIILSSKQRMTISHLLDGPKITNMSISPDGSLTAVSIRETQPPSETSESWIELYRTENRELFQTYRGATLISSINWASKGKKFSYTTRDNSQGTLWIADIDTGQSTPLLKNIQNLGPHAWSPDETYLIYSISEQGAEDRPGVKRVINMSDRQPGWRDRSFLYKVSVASGVRQRLTSGQLTTALNGISPNGKKLLFTRIVEDYSERPYSKTEIFILDLETLQPSLLWEGRWFNGAQWSPDGQRLLILGGPSTFGSLGINLPNSIVPNEYDTQAYLFDLATNSIEPISKNFDPAINEAVWSQTENCIYFVTNDRSFRHLFRYNLLTKEFDYIECGVEVLGAFSLAREKSVAVYTGSSAAVPPKSYVIDLTTRESRLLFDPEKKNFSNVTFGDVKPWTCRNKNGVDIEGLVYYPPNFSPNNKYPCIVYYYGGTSPVTRDFGGRYPKNLWAAQGYIVYVLQPSGATGFGQEFSAAHVNDWGLTVADEIIHCVTQFLKAHSFVDSNRLGCIGASYGGFMTMLLQTRTNIFTAAVAHAGISSISSYWGEGYWGYAYSAYATANSFPWNRKDIYINQSPLFNADKISTPLLLLHGSVDTNVPPGESTQLFTALKLLG